MPLESRDLVSIFDFSDREILAVFDLADEMSHHTRGNLGLADGLIMSTLFYEPSTRTRLSFESAMQRLGGGVLSVADASVTSYADLIVIRHPYEGSAKVAADYARVPVINAGDGAHEPERRPRRRSAPRAHRALAGFRPGPLRGEGDADRTAGTGDAGASAGAARA